MKFRPASFTLYAILSVVALTGLIACRGHAADQRRSRPIEFSEPKNSEVTTNLNQLTSKKDTLRQLEEDLSQHLKTLTPKSSLDGVMAPPVQRPSAPMIQNKKVKELLERRKYWYIMNPEDLTSGPTAEDMFQLPEFDKNGEEKKKKSPLEKYLYDQRKTGGRLMGDSKEDQDGGHKRIKTRKGLEDRDDDDDLPKSLAESAKSLKNLTESNASSSALAPLSQPDTLADIFGLDTKRSAADVEAHKARMEEYKQLLNFSPSPGGGVADQFNSLGGVQDWRSGGASGFDALPNSLRVNTTFKPSISPFASPASPLTTFSPPVALGGLPDVTPKVFTPAGSPLPLLRVDPPRPSAPSPVFNVPQRRF